MAWLLVCCGGIGRAASGTLDLVTTPPVPPASVEKIRELAAAVADRGSPFTKRSAAAAGLAGRTDAVAIDALRGALLVEAADPQEEAFEMACAASLAWSSYNGSRRAEAALFEAVYSPTTHANVGGRVAAALLDAIGPDAVLRDIIDRATPVDRNATPGDRIPLALSWSRQQLKAYHARGCTAPPLQVAADRLASRLRRLSQGDFLRVLDARPCREVCRELLGLAPRSGLKAALLGRLDGPPDRRRLVLATFIPPLMLEHWSQRDAALCYVLTAADLRALKSAADGLPEAYGVTVAEFVDAACYGRASHLADPNVTMRDILLDALDEEGWPQERFEEWDELARSGKVPQPWLFLWEHIGHHVDGWHDPQSHPYWRQLCNVSRSSCERAGLARSLRDTLRRGGFRNVVGFADPVLALLGTSREPIKAEETDENKRAAMFNMGLDSALGMLAIEAAPSHEQLAMAEQVFARVGLLAHIDILSTFAEDCWGTGVVFNAAWMADQMESALSEVTPGRTGWPEWYRRKCLLFAMRTAFDLTPERFLPPYEASPENDPTAFLNIWRKWLERFRELPVFRAAARPHPGRTQ